MFKTYPDKQLSSLELTASFGAETVVKGSTQAFVCTFKGDNDVSSVVWKGPKGTIATEDKVQFFFIQHHQVWIASRGYALSCLEDPYLVREVARD